MQQFGMQLSNPSRTHIDDIGKVVERIRGRLVTEFSKRGAPSETQELVIAGLQWKCSQKLPPKRTRIRPVVAHISNSLLGAGTFDVTYWARDALVLNKQNPYPFGFTAIPQGYLSLRDMKNLSSDLAVHPNIDECERIMVNAIRGVAAQHNTVGKDCMSSLVFNANGLKL